MRDEVIRIILEAKDRMSGVLSNAERNFNRSYGNIRNDLQKFDRENNEFSNRWRRRLSDEQGSIRIWGDAIEKRLRSVQDALSRTRGEFDKTNIAFGKVERGSGGQFQSVAQRRSDERAQRPVNRVISSFREGRQQASELERELRQRIATTKEELIARKRALEEEIYNRRESIIEDGNIQREQLRRIVLERSKGVAEEVLKLKQNEADRQAIRDRDLENEIRTRKSAFEDQRRIAEDQLREEIYQRKQLFYDEQYSRQQLLKDDIRSIRSSSQFSKAEKEREIDALRKAEADINRVEQRKRDDDIRALELADDKIKRKDATARDIDIAAKTAAAAEQRRLDSRATDEEVKKLNSANSERNKEDEVALASQLRQRRQAAEQEFRNLRQGLRTGANEADIVKEFLEARRAEQSLNQDTSAISRTFRGAGNAFGDFARGLRRGRSDLREVDKLARSADTAFAKFGQTIGRFTKNIGSLVNLRWYLLISAVQILGQLVLVLAANLISLASSAAIAAAALGAGLTSAIAQAIPVAGLLAATFSRVTAAFTAAQQATKANALSSQDTRAQAEAQKSAQQGLTDALYNQVQAVKALADARKQAARSIVDSLFAERDANLSLREAEFAVLDAKQQLYDLEHQQSQNQQAIKDAEAAIQEAKERLAAAKREGDQAEVSLAEQQLAIAKQNLADAQGQEATQKATKRQIEEQKLAVKRAQLQEQEARVAAKRQREDTRKTVHDGVKGSQQVQDALHGVATANRDVANAQQQVSDSSKKQASAGNLLQQQLSQLDPAERGLYKAFVRMRDNFKKTFRPITDIVIRAITGAVNRFTTLLSNPKISKAFTGLATIIAKGIGQLAKFFTGKSFVNSFIQFIHEAGRNLPSIITIIENLTTAFLNLAKAGEPVVRDILGKVAKATGKFASVTGQSANETKQLSGAADFGPQARQTRAQKFINTAKDSLDSWIKLAVAIGRVFRYLIADASGSGNSLVNSLTRFFNRMADFLRDNPSKVGQFFEDMRKDLSQLASILFPVAKVLFSAFSGDNATQFTKFTSEVVVPGLALLVQFLGTAAKILLLVSHIPGIKAILQFLVFEKALNRIFPATQRVTDAVKRMGKWFFIASEDGSRGFTKLWRAAKFMAFQVRYYSVLARDRLIAIGKGAGNVATTMATASKKFIRSVAAMIASLARLAWAMIVQAAQASKAFLKSMVESVIAGLKTLVAFMLETVIPAIVAVGEALISFIADNPVVIAIAAIIIILVLLDRKFHFIMPVIRAFGNALKEVWNWIKDNWKKILGWLTYPFTKAFDGIRWFFTKVKDFFIGIINWIKDHWKTIAEVIIAIFVPGGIILLAIYKFKDKIISVFKDILKFIKNIFHDIAHWLTEHLTPHIHIHHFFGIPYPAITFGDEKDKSTQDKSQNQDSPLIPTTGPKAPIRTPRGFSPVPSHDIGGQVKGPIGKAVPIIAHAGEWILNKQQQLKLAQKLKESTGQVSAFLFGTNQGQGRPSEGKPHVSQHGGKKKTTVTQYANYNLVSQTDDNDNVVWFIELDDASFAGVTLKDAAKIQRTHGKFIPGYIKRDSHGFTKAGQKALRKMSAFHGGYALGGIVKPSFAMGGVVTSPQSSYSTTGVSNIGGNIHHKKIEQNFKVHTQGETDWNYVMRLAAMHAQEAF